MIQLTKTDGLWTVTLNNPDKANALTGAMLTELCDIAENATDARALILTGAGKVFSAGADLDEARAGLATLLGSEPALAIVAQVEPGDVSDTFVETFRPDVVLWDLGWSTDVAPDRLARRSEESCSRECRPGLG